MLLQRGVQAAGHTVAERRARAAARAVVDSLSVRPRTAAHRARRRSHNSTRRARAVSTTFDPCLHALNGRRARARACACAWVRGWQVAVCANVFHFDSVPALLCLRVLCKGSGNSKQATSITRARKARAPAHVRRPSGRAGNAAGSSLSCLLPHHRGTFTASCAALPSASTQ